MGQTHLKEFAALPDVEVAALCDVDENQFPGVHRKILHQARPRQAEDLHRPAAALRGQGH